MFQSQLIVFMTEYAVKLNDNQKYTYVHSIYKKQAL